jgi:RNA binding exosome subunit
MTENVQNLTQEIQEQTVNSAKDFYGNALGQVKGQLESSRSELEGLMEQLPESQEDARAQLQELIDSYESITNAVDEAAQTQGVEDTVQGAVDQAQEAAGQAAEGA